LIFVDGYGNVWGDGLDEIEESFAVPEIFSFDDVFADPSIMMPDK
jgi:hypothetical protein